MEIMNFDNSGELVNITQKYFDDIEELKRLHKTMQGFKFNILDMAVTNYYDNDYGVCRIHDDYSRIMFKLSELYAKKVSELFKVFSYKRQEQISSEVLKMCRNGELKELPQFLRGFVENYNFYIKEALEEQFRELSGNYKTNQKNRITKLIFQNRIFCSVKKEEPNINVKDFELKFGEIFKGVQLYDKFITYVVGGTTHITLTKESSKILNAFFADETKIGV